MTSHCYTIISGLRGVEEKFIQIVRKNLELLPIYIFTPEAKGSAVRPRGPICHQAKAAHWQAKGLLLSGLRSPGRQDGPVVRSGGPLSGQKSQ